MPKKNTHPSSNDWPLFGILLACLSGASAPSQAEVFALSPDGGTVIGEIRTVTARHEDTLLDIARRHGLGYEEIVSANPGVDPWLPGAGTVVVLPTQFILPDTPRAGIVLNVPEMRLYYYPQPEPGEPPVVITYPTGIGRMDWSTPLGETKVVDKTADPSWYPPESIREEHAQRGDELPRVVPPGPDNPLGRYSLRLGMPGYLIHGTNKAYGIGMRVTHGCVRLYPEDVEALFHKVAVGTPVRIVDQPYKAGWKEGVLYLEAHAPLEENASRNDLTPITRAIIAGIGEHQTAEIDWEYALEIATQQRGMPIAISKPTGVALRQNTSGPTTER